jgi:hypothetical protein
MADKTLSDSSAYRDLCALHPDAGQGVPVSTAAALTSLCQEFSAAVISDDVTIRRSVMRLGASAETMTATQRLEVISSLAQVAAKSKELRRLTEEPLKKLLVAAPDPMSSISDAKKRGGILHLLSQRRAHWAAEYMARDLTSPRWLDKERVMIVAALRRNSDRWASVLHHIRTHLEVSAGSSDTATSFGEIARSVLGALRVVMAKSPAGLGEDFAAAFGDIAEFILSREQMEAKSRAKVGRELVATVDIVTAARPRLLTQAEPFEVLGHVRTKFPKAQWPKPLLQPVEAISARLRDVMIIGLRNGQFDSMAFANLQHVHGSREAALKVTRPLSKALPGLQDHVVAALVDGAVAEAVLNDLTASDETTLAVALLRAVEYETASLNLDRLNPPRNDDEERIRQLAEALVTEVRGLASRRGLECDGTPGAVVAYAPVRHRVAHGVVSRDVQIIVPGVLRRRPDGTHAVLMQAIVAPVS